MNVSGQHYAANAIARASYSQYQTYSSKFCVLQSPCGRFVAERKIFSCCKSKHDYSIVQHVA